MLAGLLLLSLGAAIVGGAAVWIFAGFWWALAAYVGIGAGTVLLVGAFRAFGASPSSEPSHRLSRAKTVF